MALLDLRKLWRLHEIDRLILDLQNQAKNLDVGQKEKIELETLRNWEATEGKVAHSLIQENIDLELKQSQAAEKAKKFDKQLYSGSVVNPREVQNIEHEIEILKKQASSYDDRLLELMDLTADAHKNISKVNQQKETLEKQIRDKQLLAAKAKEELQKKYTEAQKSRPQAQVDIPKPLLDRYEAIRKSHVGIGMAKITRKDSCEACGTLLAEKIIESVRAGNTLTCEECHRILYWTDGVL